MLKNLNFNCLNINSKIIPIVLYLSSFFLFIFNPMDAGNIAVTSFNRIIGNGLLKGIDIEKRINNFYFWYLLLYPLLFIVIHILISKIYNLTNENNQNIKNARDFLNYLSLISMIPMIFAFINKFPLDENISVSFAIVFSLCLIIATLFYMLSEKYIRVSFENFKWIMFLSILSSFLIVFFMTNEYNFYYIVFILSFYILLVIFIFIISKNNLSENNIKQIQFAAIPLMYALFFISLFLEITNILNQYNIIVHHKRFLSLFICMLLVCISGILYLLREKFKLSYFKWENWYYVALILSFSFIIMQPNLQTFVNIDLFESANHGLAVNEFFKYNKIPLIETFDAHMMSNSLWGIIYGLLNNDPFGAIFIPYSNYILPILSLLFYKLIKEFFDGDFAFFLTIFIPLQMPIIYSDFGFLGVIALIFALRKNNFSSYFIYWTSLVLICIYRLDNGAAYSFATVITLLILGIFTRKNYNLKKITLSFITVISICGILYFSICKWKRISFLDRFREILELIRSNSNWAYSSIGSSETFAFSFCYIIIPFLVVTTLASVSYLIKVKKVNVSLAQYIIVTSLAIAYLFNLSRGMVRHSLWENQIGIVLFSSILFISLAVCLLTQKSKQIFIFTFVSLSLISGLLISPHNIDSSCMVDSFFNKTTSNSPFVVQTEEKIDRVVLNNEFKNSFDSTVSFINSILEKDETYLDFTNQSLLYALSNKEKPVYVNQSPGLLSGEYSQKKFIEQVNKNDKVTFVLMPKGNITGPFSTELDDIKNSFRYYIVAEYISENFRPLCCNETVSMWVKKEKYNHILKRCKEKNLQYSLCDYNYGIAQELHYYDLKHIPYIWGTYDCKKSSNNFAYNESLTLKEDYYSINFEKINRKKGNYILIKAKSNSKGTCCLSLGCTEGKEFLQKSIFKFDIIDSKEPISYLIRVSSDFYWYSELLNSLKIEPSTQLEKLDIQILQGD